jgi:predicted esterase
MKLSSWFDVFSVQDPGYREETQMEGLVQSSQYLRDLVAGEIQELSRAWGEGEGAEKRLIFGGLSQGCAISLATLLSLNYSIGGWVGMSGFMPMRRTLKVALDPDPVEDDIGVVFEDDDAPEATSVVEASRHDQNFPVAKVLNAFRRDVLSLDELPSMKRPHVLSTPVFYGHGSEDKKVSCELGNELVTMLQQLGMNVRHQIYEGLDHCIQVPEGINDMIAVFTKNGAWPDHVDGSSMNQQ